MTVPAARLILGLEFLVMVCLFTGQLIAFGLASALLISFTIALASVLLRNLQIHCNCFGNSRRPVSPIDLLRNMGFLFCSCSGGWLAARPEVGLAIEPLDLGFTSLVALIFTLILSQLSDIYQLFYRS